MRSAGGRTPFGETVIADVSGERPLPAWAAWYAEIGAWAAEQAVESSFVIAITAPAREYAAVFVASGVVYAAFRPQLSTGPWERQFANAQRLPTNTPVRLVPTDGTKAYAGILRHCETNATGLGYYDLGGSKFPATMYRIDVLKWPDTLDDFDGATRVKTDLATAVTLHGLVPGSPQDFAGFSTADCVVVTSAASIERDLTDTLTLRSEHRPMAALRDLVRPREVRLHPRTAATRDELVPYRTLVVHARDEPDEAAPMVAARKPKVAVLDGSNTVCRWLGTAIAPATVAIVERVAPTAEAAADSLSRHRARSVEDLEIPTDLAPPPYGVEVLAWRNRGDNQ